MPSLEDLSVDQMAAATKTLHALVNNPATREITLRSIKATNPGAVIPEIDSQDKFAKQLAEEREARLALEQKMQEQQINQRIKENRERIQKSHGLDEAQTLEVEKIMVDEQIPNYDSAVKVYKASRSQAEPTTAQISRPSYDMPENAIWGKGIGNKQMLDKIAMDEAYNAFNEVMGGKLKVPA